MAGIRQAFLTQHLVEVVLRGSVDAVDVIHVDVAVGQLRRAVLGFERSMISAWMSSVRPSVPVCWLLALFELYGMIGMTIALPSLRAISFTVSRRSQADPSAAAPVRDHPAARRPAAWPAVWEAAFARTPGTKHRERVRQQGSHARPRFLLLGHWENFFVPQTDVCRIDRVRAIPMQKTTLFVRRATTAMEAARLPGKPILPCLTASVFHFPVDDSNDAAVYNALKKGRVAYDCGKVAKPAPR